MAEINKNAPILEVRNLCMTFKSGGKRRRKSIVKAIDNVSFDVYKGERLGKDKKSLAYTITLRSPDHTLTDAEINAVMDKVLSQVEKLHGAVLRA